MENEQNPHGDPLKSYLCNTALKIRNCADSQHTSALSLKVSWSLAFHSTSTVLTETH